jgi:hypothetical protein
MSGADARYAARAVLARLDAVEAVVEAEVAAARALLEPLVGPDDDTAPEPDAEPEPEPDDTADDLAEHNLIDTTTAAERFGWPRDTIRRWCRDNGCGEKRGGRWLASIPLIKRRIELNRTWYPNGAQTRG